MLQVKNNETKHLSEKYVEEEVHVVTEAEAKFMTGIDKQPKLRIKIDE